MTRSTTRLAFGALVLGLAAPALALTFDAATGECATALVDDDVPEKKKTDKDKKAKTVTVWVLESKGGG